MNIGILAAKSIRHRKFLTCMTAISIGLSTALLLGVQRIRESGKESFGGAISQTDLIVGPRTGSLALLLYSVFRIGSPSQNLSMESVDAFAKHPAVDWVVPFSLGDGYRGFPVIGTSQEFFKRFKFGKSKSLKFLSEREPDFSGDWAVIGSAVSAELRQKIGDKIVVAHGHSEDGDGFEKHEGHPLSIIGVLEPTGTPVDRGVWISLESMESMHEGIEHDAVSDTPKKHDVEIDSHAVHEEHGSEKATPQNNGSEEDDHDEHGDHDEHEHQGVSGFFLGTKDRSAALSLMREINTYSEEAMTAIMPAVVLNDLWKTMATAETVLVAITAMVALIGIFGMWVSLHILASTRTREIAVFRALGASPRQVLALMTGEAVLICFVGITFGILFLYLSLLIIAPYIERKYGLALSIMGPSEMEMIYLGAMLVLSAFAGLVPALKAYRTAMQDGLSVRF